MPSIDTELDVRAYPPPSESLLFGLSDETSCWPASIRTQPNLAREAYLRRSAYADIRELFRLVPDPYTECTDAVSRGLIQEDPLARVYASLATLLEDPWNARIVLYLPFELIPDQSFIPATKNLAIHMHRFVDRYIDRWLGLLSKRDIRANFVDGDIHEEEIRTGPVPRVVKAAHLIPVLVQKGLLRMNFVERLLTDNGGTTLAESIVDTFLILNRMGFPTSRQSSARSPQATGMFTGPRSIEMQSWIDSFHRDLAALPHIPKEAVPARVQWLHDEHERRVIETYSAFVARHLIANTLSFAELATLVRTHKNTTALRVVAGAIKQRITQSDDFPVPLPMLKKLWDCGESALQDDIASVLYYAHAAGQIDSTALADFDLDPPHFDATFDTMRHALRDDIKIIEDAVRSIQASDTVQAYLYPVVIVFGSRVKGYGRLAADLDVAVFVRPDVPFEERGKIQGFLRELFRAEKIGGKAVEFWTYRQGNNLCVHDVPDPDTAWGDSTFTHVLFNGVWVGEYCRAAELHEQLLAPYLREPMSTTKEVQRRAYIERMEIDALQYRLMHKGYRRFFPHRGYIDATDADAVDGQSSFWDAGYRRFATTLFITKLFLPQRC